MNVATFRQAARWFLKVFAEPGTCCALASEVFTTGPAARCSPGHTAAEVRP